MKRAYLFLMFVTIWLTSACEQSDRSMNKGDNGLSAAPTETGTINNLSLSALDPEKAYELCGITSQYHLFRKNNLTYNQVREVKMDAEKVDYIEGEEGYLYIKLNAQITKDVGNYAEPSEFLVQNRNGKVVIVDWYTSGNDSYDSIPYLGAGL